MVIDASALIAFLRKEEGHDKVARVLSQRECVLSAVTRTELVGKLVSSGSYTESEVKEALVHLADALVIVPFDSQQSDLAAPWYARRKPYNLRLGACVCIALAEARSLDVLTAESAWAKLPNLRAKVNPIR